MQHRLMALAVGTVLGMRMSAATVAQAQVVTAPNKLFSFGAAAGVSVPLTPLSDIANTGYNATLIFGLNTPTLPMNFRIEAAYNGFGLKGANSGHDAHIGSVTGNAVFTFPIENPTALRPYLIAGIGLYNRGGSDANGNPFGAASSTDFGFDVGGGLTIPLSGFNTFVEARYNRVATSGSAAQFIPIVFGMMF